MSLFWVTFTNGKRGTIEGDRPNVPWDHSRKPEETALLHTAANKAALDDALRRAAQFGTVSSIDIIPYPAKPQLDVRWNCPSFCYSPETCKGKTSCPKSRACDD